MPSASSQFSSKAQTVGATTADRRRVPRRHLHRPVYVRLVESGGEGRECYGVMLNASPIGMACRVSESATGFAQVGQSVRLVFSLGRKFDFDLPARVINRTESATPGQLVVGMEFRLDAERASEEARLKAALAAACIGVEGRTL
jgi:hypothetical protein